MIFRYVFCGLLIIGLSVQAEKTEYVYPVDEEPIELPSKDTISFLRDNSGTITALILTKKSDEKGENLFAKMLKNPLPRLANIAALAAAAKIGHACYLDFSQTPLPAGFVIPLGLLAFGLEASTSVPKIINPEANPQASTGSKVASLGWSLVHLSINVGLACVIMPGMIDWPVKMFVTAAAVDIFNIAYYGLMGSSKNADNQGNAKKA
jgi:hypothetical protein